MATTTNTTVQNIIFKLKAEVGNSEQQVKSLMKSMSNTSLGDKAMVSYQNQLIKVMEKLQLMQVALSNSKNMSSKTAIAMSKDFDKLVNQASHLQNKISGTPISFANAIGYDKAEFNAMMANLKKLEQEQANIFKNAKARADKSTAIGKAPRRFGADGKEVESSAKLAGVIFAKDTISDEKELNKVFDARIIDAELLLNKATADEASLKRRIELYDDLKLAQQALKATGAGSDAEKAAISRINELTGKKVTKRAGALTNVSAGITNNTVTDIQRDSLPKMTSNLQLFKDQLTGLQTYKGQVVAFARDLTSEFNQLTPPIERATKEVNDFKAKVVQSAKADMDPIVQDINNVKAGFDRAGDSAQKLVTETSKIEQTRSFFTDLRNNVTQIFGLVNALQVLRRFTISAWESIKELDKGFTEIAVVTSYSVEELWKTFSSYNTMAQRLGVTTADAIETSALYYQQGLKTKEVMILTTETIKMAQIAGMGFADATQAMTAALRGFKMEMSDANQVTDIYSALAASAAVDTNQLALAISKTASIAGSAGMTLSATSAFLTQIIETTQEAPETAGTALKTIIARFTELTKNPATLTVEVDGEMVNANKVEAALKTAKVDLRDDVGQFRELNTVFTELSGKWDGLDRNTQRYIATIAAGARQQSRFIAMMDNHKRTIELIDIANNSAGASTIQFAKTLGSVQSKLNILKAQFQALIGNLVQNSAVKGFFDMLIKGMDILVNASNQGAASFGTLLVVIGFVAKNALMLMVSAFSKIGDQYNILVGKVKASPMIAILTANIQPALEQLNVFRVAAGQQPIIIPVETTGGNATSGAFMDDGKGGNLFANSKNQAQIDINNKKNLADKVKVKKAGYKAAAVGIGISAAMGIATAAASGDVMTGVVTALVSSISMLASSPAVLAAFQGVFAAIGGLLPAVLVGAATIGVVLLANELLNPVKQAERKAKDIQKKIDLINRDLEVSKATSLADTEQIKLLSAFTDKYKELTSLSALTVEQQDELTQAMNDMAEAVPELISYYDAAGNAIIKQGAAYDEIIKKEEEIARLSQQKYAQDLLNTSLLTEDKRLTDIDAKKKAIEQETNRVDPVSYKNISNPVKIKALTEELAILEAQGTLTANSIKLAYQTVANSNMMLYDASQSANKKISNDLYGSLQESLGTKLAGAPDATAEEAQVTAQAYIKAFQEQLDKSTIDTTKLAEDTAGMTQKQFIGYLATHGITQEQDDQLYTTLTVKFEEDNKVFNDIINKITTPTFVKGEGRVSSNRNRKSVTDIFSPEQITNIGNQYGTDLGSSLIEGILKQVESGDVTKEVAGALLSTKTIDSLETAKTATVDIMNQTKVSYEEAAAAVILLYNEQNRLNGVTPESPITAEKMLNSGSMATEMHESTLTATERAVELLDTFQELDTATREALLEESPELNNLMLEFANNTNKTTADYKKFKAELQKVGDYKKVVKMLDTVNEQLDVYNEKIKDKKGGGPETEAALEQMATALGGVEQGFTSDLVKSHIEDVKKMAKGDNEAYDRLTQAARDNLISLAESKFKIDLSDFTSEISAIEKEYNDFIGEVDNQGIDFIVTGKADFSALIVSMAIVGTSLAQMSSTLSALSGMTMKVERNYAAQSGYGQFGSGGGMTLADTFKTTVTAPKVKTPNFSTYKPKTSGGGGGGNDYKTKSEEFANEIDNIKRLTAALEELARARAEDDLNPEAYKKNIEETIALYDREGKIIKDYNAKLLARRNATGQALKQYSKYVEVGPNGLKINYAALSKLTGDAPEKIDGLITKWTDYNDTIKENNKSLKANRAALEALYDAALSARVSLEQRVAKVLEDNASKEIDTQKKKYDELKKQDDDYLKALKKNIDDRRNARDKEDSYSDLAKQQKRLALLKRDTSGIYATEILSLEAEIKQARQDLADKETDDYLQALEDQSALDAENNDKLIAKQEEVLKAAQEGNKYLREAEALINTLGSGITQWLKLNSQEYLDSTGAGQKTLDSQIGKEMATAASLPATQILMNREQAQASANIARASLIGAGYTQGVSDISSKSATGALAWFTQYIAPTTKIMPEEMKKAFYAIVKAKFLYEGLPFSGVPGYSKGGLVDYTGIAAVHGSTSSPEAFLSAQDTKNFSVLSELLNDAMKINKFNPSAFGVGNTNTVGDCNIVVNVDSIDSDYGVERAVQKVKQQILDSSGYRNVNLLNRVR